jgi:hypothetical protein
LAIEDRADGEATSVSNGASYLYNMNECQKIDKGTNVVDISDVFPLAAGMDRLDSPALPNLRTFERGISGTSSSELSAICAKGFFDALDPDISTGHTFKILEHTFWS